MLQITGQSGKREIEMGQVVGDSLAAMEAVLDPVRPVSMKRLRPLLIIKNLSHPRASRSKHDFSSTANSIDEHTEQ